MSQSLLQNNQNSDDSDVTYCPELELQSRKRVRRRTQLYQDKSNTIIRLEAIADKVFKQHEVKKNETTKLWKTLKQFKPKNKGDQDAIYQLTEKLKNFRIENTQIPKHNICNKNKNLNNVERDVSKEIEHNFSDAGASTILNQTSYQASEESQDNCDLDTNEIVNHINFEHDYCKFDATKDILSPIINFDVSPELVQTYSDIDMKEILNCIDYNPSQDIVQNVGDSHADYDPSHVFQVSSASETLNNKNLEIPKELQNNFGGSQANEILNYENCDFSPMFQDTQTLNDINFENSNYISTNEALSVDYNTFENFLHKNSISLVENNNITIHSDFKINKPEQPENQQLIDKYLQPSCSNSTQDFKFSAENQTSSQTNETWMNNRSSSKTALKKKTRGKKKKRVTQDNTQSTIRDYFSSQNDNEKENETMNCEEINVNEMSPRSKKNHEIQRELKEAVELMKSSKRDFKARLLARKEEILKLRNMELSCKKEEASNSLKFSDNGDKNKTDLEVRKVQVDNCNLITKQELLQNMQVLQEISAQYKKKYKNRGIDIFSDSD